MAINTYTTLKAAVEDWLVRADLTARVPDFIALFEAKMNRELRCAQMETRSYATVNTSSNEPEFVTLPGDFQTMRRLRLSGETGKPSLEFVSAQQMDSFRYDRANVSGVPAYYTIVGEELELFQTPNDGYELEILYRANLDGLSGSNSSNWLLDIAPDAYFYGTLMEAAPYLEDDERIPLWAAGLQNAVDGLNRIGFEQTFAAGPSAVRLEGPTP